VGGAERECGDALEFSLVVRGGEIRQIGFVHRSCVITLACASMASTLAQGKTPIEARRTVTPEAVIQALGGVPASEEHSAELAVEALRKALDDYIFTEREPWRRVYRKL
jgi:NifU-like protein involved in Fe-S cluster formation